jgi:predicted nuclease of predicted toxin-antitoxin system
MKILIDENLPARLTTSLRDLFTDMHHVDTLSLKSKPDTEVWRYAASQEYEAF